MKTINVSIEQMVQGVAKPTVKKGRPKTHGAIVLPVEPEMIPADFYQYISGLAENEIDNFLKTYSPTLPFGSRVWQPATKQDVFDFQKDLKLINKYIPELKTLEKTHARTPQLIEERTSEELENGKRWILLPVINCYLDNVSTRFNFGHLIQSSLTATELADYQANSDAIDTDPSKTKFLINDVLNPKGNPGTNFGHFSFKTNSIFSWCVLNLVADQFIHGKSIRGCQGCEALFIAEPRHLRYCQKCTTNKRGAARSSRFRASKAKI